MEQGNVFTNIQIHLKSKDDLVSFIEFNEGREKTILNKIAEENSKLDGVRSLLSELRAKLNNSIVLAPLEKSIKKTKSLDIQNTNGYPFGGIWIDKLLFILKSGNPEGMVTKEILDSYFSFEPTADKGTAMKSATGILSIKSKEGGPLLADKSSGRYVYKINPNYGINKIAESVSNQLSIS